ncbi:MAG: 30S ribosomal protein S1 [Armatimonadetes bacterium]|nr:30S ribosomal protein S1 [Armatimonadota bacterium]
MSDEKTDRQTHLAAGQEEWTGTPFQGWKEPEDGQNGADEQKETVVESSEAAETVLQVEDEQPSVETAVEETSEVRETADVQAAPRPAESSAQQVDYSRTFRSLSEGDVVNGVVVHIDKEGVLVDVGTKSEGLIRPSELSRQANLEPEDVVQVGDKIDVYVMQSEDHEGNLMLSKKRADFERAWERVEDSHRTGKVLTAMVTDRVKGGLVVDLGIRGFVPASHVGSGKLKNLEKFVGQSLQLKVIEVDRDRRKVVLSNRRAVEEERSREREETVAALAEGQIKTGIVRRITDYGAFVDLGGIDGLLHISEMSWTRVNHPSEVVKVGEKIQVAVLKLNLQHGKISLGLRQILPDPWRGVERKYSVGDVIKGSISRLVPFGAFVLLDGGIEGIIPNAELASKRVNKPEDVVSVGQEVEIRVIDLRPEERRMTLSIRQLQQQKEREKERAEFESYSSYGGRGDGRTTIGDLVGDTFREARAERRERKRRERDAEDRVEEAEVDESLSEPMFTPESEQEVEAEASIADVKTADEEPEAGAEEMVAAVEAPEARPEEETAVTAEAVEVSAEPRETSEFEARPVAPTDEPAVDVQAQLGPVTEEAQAEPVTETKEPKAPRRSASARRGKAKPATEEPTAEAQSEAPAAESQAEVAEAKTEEQKEE